MKLKIVGTREAAASGVITPSFCRSVQPGVSRLSHLVSAQGAGLGSSGLAAETAAGTQAQTYREPVWPSGKALGW